MSENQIHKARTVKTATQFAESAYDKMQDTVRIIDDLKAKLAESEAKVQHLEDLLKHSNTATINTKPESGLLRKTLEEEIIEVEIKRFHDRVVLGGESLEGSDLRKFDTLIKDLVSLRGKLEKKTKKDEDGLENASTADLLELVLSNDE